MFDLSTYLRERQAETECRLAELLPETGLQPARLGDAMRHAVLTGGKRLRPLVCLAADEAVGGAVAAAWPAALALELLHAYTLVHDDLPCMDNDLIRRGQPTVHAKYGATMAVLAGDALQALAFETVAASAADVAVALTRELARAAGAAGVVGGQVEDILSGGTADEAMLRFVHQHKTADLFRAAARMGAIAGNGTAAQIEQVGAYGNALGLAFQMVDDLLDAPESRPGRAPELSCLNLMKPESARHLAADYTAQARAALAGLPGPCEPLDALATMLLKRIA